MRSRSDRSLSSSSGTGRVLASCSRSFLCSLRHPGGHDHPHEDVQVAAALAAEVREALVAQAQQRPRLGSLGHVELGAAAVERGDLHRGAQGRLRHAHRDLAEQVGAVALEERVRLDADDDVEVPGRAAGGARLAFAGDAELAVGVHSGRDLDLELALHRDLPLSAALLALAGDDAARAAAAAAGPGHAEEALLERHLSAASAGGAGRRLGAGGGARAAAGGAVLRARYLDGGSVPKAASSNDSSRL